MVQEAINAGKRFMSDLERIQDEVEAWHILPAAIASAPVEHAEFQTTYRKSSQMSLKYFFFICASSYC